MRGLRIYMKYLPEPIREETPTLMESSSSKPLKVNRLPQQLRTNANEDNTQSKKPPLNKTKQLPSMQTPKFPFARPNFIKKPNNQEPNGANNHVNRSVNQIQ